MEFLALKVQLLTAVSCYVTRPTDYEAEFSEV